MAISDSLTLPSNRDIQRLLDQRLYSAKPILKKTPKKFVTYREAELRDTSLLVDIAFDATNPTNSIPLPTEQTLWRDRRSLSFQKTITDPNSVVIIAETFPAKIVGYAIAQKIGGKKGAVVIYEFHVEKRDDENRIRKTLLNHVETWTKKQAMKRLQLRTHHPDESLFSDDPSFQETYTVFEKAI